MSHEICASAADLAVDIGFPTGATVPWQTTMSLAKTVKACTQRRIDVGVCCIAGSSVVTWARDKVLDTFLNERQSKHLFWIDSDIVWEPGDFIRLLALATRYGVVCGTYAQKTEAQGLVIHRENITDFAVNPHGLLEIDGAGLGFTVVSREIMQELSDTKPLVYDPAGQRSIRSVFRLDTMDRGGPHPYVRHEDVAFFADLRELGHKVWLDPTIRLGHVGAREYRSNPLESLRLTEAYQANGQSDNRPVGSVGVHRNPDSPGVQLADNQVADRHLPHAAKHECVV